MTRAAGDVQRIDFPSQIYIKNVMSKFAQEESTLKQNSEHCSWKEVAKNIRIAFILFNNCLLQRISSLEKFNLLVHNLTYTKTNHS